MKSVVANPREWLTDSGLTESGKMARKTYARFVDDLYSLGLPDFKVSRALHLLQSNGYDTIPDGYALPPHTINLSLNNRCNFKCSYCDLNRETEHWDHSNTKAKYSTIDPKKTYELPLETCKEIIDQVAWFRPVIRAHWMESLLYSDLLPLIDYTKKEKKLPFSMLTNGYLLTRFAKDLVAGGVDALRISLDGPADIHDALCGVRGAYDKILEGLKALVEECKRQGHEMQIGAYFTVTDKNYTRMVEVIEDLDRHGLLEHMFFGFYLFNYISEDMVALHNAEHAGICGVKVEETSSLYVDVTKIDPKALMAQQREIKERFKGMRIHFRPNYTEDNLEYCLSTKAIPLDNVRCETHWHSLCINPEGFVKPMSQCILEPCGNINEHTLMDVWNGPEIRDQRLKLQQYGAYHGCMRCWSIYSNIEDAQGSWKDPAGK